MKSPFGQSLIYIILVIVAISIFAFTFNHISPWFGLAFAAAAFWGLVKLFQLWAK